MELQLMAGPRRRLPSRRHSETRRLAWAGQTIHVTVGYDDNLEPKEVFYSGGYRSGSDMEALVSDLCIALSVMLQHEGVTRRHPRQVHGRDVRRPDPRADAGVDPRTAPRGAGPAARIGPAASLAAAGLSRPPPGPGSTPGLSLARAARRSGASPCRVLADARHGVATRPPDGNGRRCAPARGRAASRRGFHHTEDGRWCARRTDSRACRARRISAQEGMGMRRRTWTGSGPSPF